MQDTITSQKSGSLGWIVQSISGLALIALLSLHMIANHFVVPGGLQTYQDVVRYLSNPLILALEISFLVIVTIHALLGVRAIVQDINISDSGQRSLNRFLSVLGVLIILYGLWLTYTIVF